MATLQTHCATTTFLLMTPVLAAAAELPAELKLEADREAFQWLLDREDARPFVQRHRKSGDVEWIGFEGENKYRCSLHLDDAGRADVLSLVGTDGP